MLMLFHSLSTVSTESSAVVCRICDANKWHKSTKYSWKRVRAHRRNVRSTFRLTLDTLHLQRKPQPSPAQYEPVRGYFFSAASYAIVSGEQQPSAWSNCSFSQVCWKKKSIRNWHICKKKCTKLLQVVPDWHKKSNTYGQYHAVNWESQRYACHL